MKKKNTNKTIIVVPTYNEKGNIERVYREIFKASGTSHLLIVDDNSPDGTGFIADELARRDKRVNVLHRDGKMGLGSAYIHGMKFALSKGYAHVVAMDADLSHDPINIPKMLKLIKDYDLVIGSRYVKDGNMVNWGAGRFLISRFANGLCRWILGMKQADCSGGYKCYRTSLLEKIGMNRIFSKGYCFQVEILCRALVAGARVVEIPIVFVNRHEGKSKLNTKELAEFGLTILRLKWLSMAKKL